MGQSLQVSVFVLCCVANGALRGWIGNSVSPLLYFYGDPSCPCEVGVLCLGLKGASGDRLVQLPTQEYGLVIENAGHVEVSGKTGYFTAFTVGISVCLGVWVLF